jgi:hypothetical protein
MDPISPTEGLPIPIQELIDNSAKINWGDKEVWPEDVIPHLQDLQKTWRDTLVLEKNDKKGKIVQISKNTHVVIAGQEPVSIEGASKEQPLNLIVPIVDGLKFDAGSGDYILNVEERAVGGSQLVVKRTEGDIIKSEVDHESMRRAVAAMQAGDLESVARIRLKSNPIQKKTMAKIILTGNSDPKLGSIMPYTDNLRIDEIMGGLMMAKCSGPVQFKK